MKVLLFLALFFMLAILGKCDETVRNCKSYRANSDSYLSRDDPEAKIRWAYWKFKFNAGNCGVVTPNLK